MNFTHPGWLGGGAVACLLLVFLWYRYDRRQHAALAQFISPHLRVQLTQSVSVARRRAQRGSLLLAVALLCVALAGPQYGYRWEQISRRGNEIVFAVDTSRSMTTPDVKPDRLSRAKLAIDDFIKQLDGDAVGLVAFAGTAFLVCPITLDYGAFHESLSALDTNIIPRGGTNIASAIREAQAALRRRPGSDKILILVTDGEDLEGNALTAAQSAAAEDKLRIYSVGVGTANGDLIPLVTTQGSGFVKDDAGNFVKSHLDESALQRIAEATGGLYTPLGQQGEGLEMLYKTALGPLAKHELASRQQKIYTQRYQWPLAASLAALLLSLVMGTRRRGAAPAAPAAFLSAALLGVACLATLTPHLARADVAGGSLPDPGQKIPGARAAQPPVGADSPVKEPVRQYNAGTAAYKAGQFSQAAKAFQESISRVPSNDAKRLADQQDAYYNLGNALYRTGQKAGQGAPQETLKNWNAAVKAYDTALQLRADDADSKFNRDFVQRKIDELKQQQQQNQQNQQNQKDQKNSPGQPGQQPQQPGSQQNDPKQGDKSGDPGQQPSSGNPNGSPPQQKPGQAGNEPPPAANQPKPSAGGDGKPADQQPQGRQPQGQPPQGNPDQQADADARQADNEHLPGQMSREEARELLDSVKGEEHQALGTPLARSESDRTSQDQPLKDW